MDPIGPRVKPCLDYSFSGEVSRAFLLFFLAVLISINTFRGYKDKSGASKVVFFFRETWRTKFFHSVKLL